MINDSLVIDILVTGLDDVCRRCLHIFCDKSELTEVHYVRFAVFWVDVDLPRRLSALDFSEKKNIKINLKIGQLFYDYYYFFKFCHDLHLY